MFVALAAFYACASTSIVIDRSLPASTQLEVPFEAQPDRHCGPASLAMLLAWSGQRVSASDLAEIAYTPQLRGSLTLDLIAAARRNGRLPYPVSSLDDLLEEVAAGHPVMILQNLGLSWLPRWHHAVVTGYDLGARTLTLHSGAQRATAQFGSTRSCVPGSVRTTGAASCFLPRRCPPLQRSSPTCWKRSRSSAQAS